MHSLVSMHAPGLAPPIHLQKKSRVSSHCGDLGLHSLDQDYKHFRIRKVGNFWTKLDWQEVHKRHVLYRFKLAYRSFVEGNWKRSSITRESKELKVEDCQLHLLSPLPSLVCLLILCM